MKKILLFGVGSLLVLCVVGYIVLQFFLGGIVKSGVNNFGPRITQTPVLLESASLSPLSGAGTLTGLSVANPEGWSRANAFRLGKVHIDMEPFSVLKDHIVINELIIDQPEFLYETRVVSSNIGDLLKNIEQSMGGGKDAEPKTKDGKPIKMVIKKLSLREGKVSLGMGGTAMTLPMPPINLTDLGTAEGGITPAQVAFAVMRSVTSAIVSASAQAFTKVGGTGGAAAVEGAKQVGNAIKGLFGGQKKTEAAPAPAPEPKK